MNEEAILYAYELFSNDGYTGNSSGPHLHFEARDNARWSAGKDVDPKDILAI